MVRAVSLMADDAQCALRDTLLLCHEERRAPSGVKRGLRGTEIDLQLPAGTRLRHEDRLLLDDGSAVEIVARPEPLLEARTGDLALLARAAWLVGDHHIPAEIHGRYLRVLRTDLASTLLRSLGVTVREIDAPFEPEGGAYEHAGHDPAT
jgi:urease accessory protein